MRNKDDLCIGLNSIVINWKSKDNARCAMESGRYRNFVKSNCEPISKFISVPKAKRRKGSDTITQAKASACCVLLPTQRRRMGATPSPIFANHFVEMTLRSKENRNKKNTCWFCVEITYFVQLFKWAPKRGIHVKEQCTEMTQIDLFRLIWQTSGASHPDSACCLSFPLQGIGIGTQKWIYGILPYS